MDWPAYSPDLNPIEHVWDMLGRRIAAHQPPLTCPSELRRALFDEWCNIPQDQIDNLILSMPRRCDNRLAPGLDCMMDTLKLPNEASRVSGESLQKCVVWRCSDETQRLFFWPILGVSG
ncbi:transposable element Tcb1 transposase [Trichonephila clavipes]|nr:transposable element Tcb1 transposase [Trichonephila clavipes]